MDTYIGIVLAVIRNGPIELVSVGIHRCTDPIQHKQLISGADYREHKIVYTHRFPHLLSSAENIFHW